MDAAAQLLLANTTMGNSRFVAVVLLLALGTKLPGQGGADAPPPLPEPVAAAAKAASDALVASALASSKTCVGELCAALQACCVDARSPAERRVAQATALRREIAAFASEGTAPILPPTVAPLARHRARMEAAADAYRSAMDRLAEPYLRTDEPLARAISGEKQRVLASNTFAKVEFAMPAPDVVDLCVAEMLREPAADEQTRPSSDHSPTLVAVAPKVRQARREHADAILAARGGILKSFERAESSLRNDRKLSVDDRLARLAVLAQHRDAVLRTGDLPIDHSLPAAEVRAYEQRVAVANKKLWQTMEAIAGCIGQDIDVAAAVVRIREDMLETEVVATVPAAARAKASGTGSSDPSNAEVVAGKWRTEGGEVLQEGMGRRQQAVVFGDPAWGEYDFTVQARAEDGLMCMKVLFLFADAKNCREFAVGGYDNSCADTIKMLAGKWSRAPKDVLPRAVEADRWYTMEVQVRTGRVRCLLDGEVLFDSIETDLTAGRIGLATWGTKARFRSLVVKEPGGKVLWQGLPRL